MLNNIEQYVHIYKHLCVIQYALIILIPINGILSAYTSKFQSTTLWAGKKIASEELKDIKPNGYQDAITPKVQNIRNILKIILSISIFIIGTIKIWYLGVFGLVCVFIISNIASKCIPDKIEFYLFKIFTSLVNREANYLKNNDEMRAEACADICYRLEKLISEIRETNIKVPSIYEAKAQ